MTSTTPTTPPTTSFVDQKCGFISLIGAPNAGKSTLMNALVGAKVSIVTHKVQTTRSRIIGIAMRGQCQMVFIDTPGIFKPKRRLEKAMVSAAWQGARDADIVALLIDASKKMTDEVMAIIQELKDQDKKVLLVLNKIDQMKRDKLLAVAADLNTYGIFTKTYMISALKGDGVDHFMDDLQNDIPKGPWMYDEDQISDMPARLLAAEITREKLFLRLHQEMPYSVAVETEGWENFKNGSVKISQVVYVMRDNQKGIVLGRGGAQIKAIGEAARRELEDILEQRVHLKIFVKVREKWVDDPERYSDWGLDFNA
jgi:GTP-binding protein Era